MVRSLVVGMLVLLAVACVPANGRLEANRFQHGRYPYAVFYSEPVRRDSPFGPGWRVDEAASRTETTASKTGGRYTLNRIYDLNGDGRGDFERLEQRYDLLLENTSEDATLWVATFPLAEREAGAELSELAQHYAHAMAAQGELVPSFGPEKNADPSAGGATTQVSDQRPCELSKRQAVRLDVRFTHQNQSREASLVFVRTGYVERVFDGANGSARYPVFMVVGNMAHEGKRAALEPAFQSFLDHTVLGDQGLGLSLKGENTCGKSAPPASAGGEAAPPAAPENHEQTPEELLAPMPTDSAAGTP